MFKRESSFFAPQIYFNLIFNFFFWIEKEYFTSVIVLLCPSLMEHLGSSYYPLCAQQASRAEEKPPAQLVASAATVQGAGLTFAPGNFGAGTRPGQATVPHVLDFWVKGNGQSGCWPSRASTTGKDCGEMSWGSCEQSELALRQQEVAELWTCSPTWHERSGGRR